MHHRIGRKSDGSLAKHFQSLGVFSLSHENGAEIEPRSRKFRPISNQVAVSFGGCCKVPLGRQFVRVVGFLSTDYFLFFHFSKNWISNRFDLDMSWRAGSRRWLSVGKLKPQTREFRPDFQVRGTNCQGLLEVVAGGF